ncbi:unnamed protein product [Clavelina lepadiformis]|uniref:Claudin n=1 Tax=Clavelina lepadiformis TaxID=159417 RepID=A0ABP0FU40_CLALP
MLKLSREQKIQISVFVFSILAAILNSVALSSDTWLRTLAAGTYGLFYKCNSAGCTQLDPATDLAQCGSAWLDAVRAFVIMADIVMYSAVIIYTVGFFWQDDKVGIKLRWLAAILIIASGIFSLIGCVVFQANGVSCLLPSSAVLLLPYGFGLILAWLGFVLSILAGAMALIANCISNKQSERVEM